MKRSLFVIVACGALACEAPPAAPVVSPVPPAPARTLPVEAAQVPVTLERRGAIVSARDVAVSATVSGRVALVAVERGQAVRAGDVLAVLRIEDLDFAHAAADAQLRQLSSRLAGAGRPEAVPAVVAARTAFEVSADALRRAEALAERGSVSQQDLLRARAAEASARASLDAAVADARALLAQVHEARVVVSQRRAAQREATLRAPFDGVVFERLVSAGDVVLAGAPLVRLVDPDALRVRLDLTRDEAARVEPAARVWIQGAGGRRFEARLSRWAPGFAGAVQLRAVEADVTPQTPFFGGERVRVDVETTELEALWRVPAPAVDSRQGAALVQVLTPAGLDARLLEVVRVEEGGALLVRGGLREGERVAVRPTQLAAGQQVTP
ncbi:MAG: efflux RND transporter periplasmic adaptor subunit [Myxococcaceae bacterium]|jgi:RND family efflux transporter MFP subunit|nr:efflux RND transporter periplasmic adaptor subunit [Myxococcaceae bacterium]